MPHGAAQYRVGAQLGVDPQAPSVGLEPRGEHRRAAPLPGLQHLEQVDRVERVLDRRREEVVQDEQVRPREAVVFSQVSLAEKSAPFFRVSARKFFGFRRRHAPSFLTCRA